MQKKYLNPIIVKDANGRDTADTIEQGYIVISEQVAKSEPHMQVIEMIFWPMKLIESTSDQQRLAGQREYFVSNRDPAI
jgi:hypothetical protein